mmetsp:Transcript_22020/g.25329  ORF Transcript_22020/g.25329 Transcript_22020/m.25329 type:complete len:122 (+) Transcript_22020:740-1105(+)|eukprot:CAMPEP_0168339792 /NCGR_PEP_ID=MMETSP0213-20121227/13675_1 /TAXON_ID=151035 /ORGANISM="Euplotes harpa, Strain FSP1.4" /LENGTH=121 /DNA_ID=CAMNT_0008345897 /DNA_START=1788 /DNA_END=2153 /DNA_ORIENTATION=-
MIQDILSELLSDNKLSPKYELKDRRDVVNKTLLRVIRRYFQTSFRQAFPQKRFRAKNKCVAQLMGSVEQFSARYSDAAPPRLLRALFGNLVNQKLFRKGLANKRDPEAAEAAEFVSQLVAC